MVLRIFWNVGSGLITRALSKSRIPPGIGIQQPAVWKARPGFLDCDATGTLNQASYQYAMELARWHYTAINGILATVIREKAMFLVASQGVRHYTPIKAFQSYEVRTKIEYADDNWIYMRHTFHNPDTNQVYADGLARAAVIAPGKRRMTAHELLASIGEDTSALESTTIPSVVENFLRWDAASKTSMEQVQSEHQSALLKVKKK